MILNNEGGKTTIIINGGNPLDGCPKNWDEAKQWQEKANATKERDFSEPNWSFDCGFKLDFDGALLHVSSRFYPPATHYGSTWDGAVHIMFDGKELIYKKFDCKTLDELKGQVENYVSEIKQKIHKALFTNWCFIIENKD